MARGNYGKSHREGPEVLPDPDAVGGTVTFQEIEDALADEGYSAAERKEWLKEVLTQLSRQDPRTLSAQEREIVAKIKEILEDYQSGGSKSDDMI